MAIRQVAIDDYSDPREIRYEAIAISASACGRLCIRMNSDSKIEVYADDLLRAWRAVEPR